MITNRQTLKKKNKKNKNKTLTKQTGVHTTASTLIAGFYLLSKNLSVQEKVYLELKNYIKNKKNKEMFDFIDLPHLPLFKACVHEIIRVAIVAPFGIDRWTLKDINATYFNHKTQQKQTFFIPKSYFFTFLFFLGFRFCCDIL